MRVAGSWLMVTWAGGGNVNPFIGLAGHLMARGHRVGALATRSLLPRLAGAGMEIVGAADGWLASADGVGEAVERFSPDALIIDYMLTGALSGAERCGLTTVVLVHALYTALLADGAPYPIAMSGPVAAINEVRSGLGLAPIAAHADLVAAADLVLVAAPRQLDVAGEVPANVVYAGALFEGPGEDAGWLPPGGDGPLVVVSVGTAGDAAADFELLGRILRALSELPVRGFVTQGRRTIRWRAAARRRTEDFLCGRSGRCALRVPPGPTRCRQRRGVSHRATASPVGTA